MGACSGCLLLVALLANTATGSTIFDALEPGHTQLAPVNQALAAGDTTTAADALLQAMRARRQPGWPMRRLPPQPPSQRQHAWGEAALERDLTAIFPDAPALPDTPDWRIPATSQRAQDLLDRFQLTHWLVVAHRDTANERYAQGFVTLVEAFLETATDTTLPAWRGVAVHERVRHWLMGYGAFLDTQAMTPAFSARLLGGLTEHAALLARRHADFTQDTEQLHELTALALIALHLPEVRHAEGWHERAWRLLQRHLEDGVNRDGVAHDLDLVRQAETLDSLLHLVGEQKRVGHEAPQAALQRLPDLCRPFARLLQPNGAVDDLASGASVADVCARILQPTAVLIPDQSDDFLFPCQAWGAASGTPLANGFQSCRLPDTHVAVLRHGWGPGTLHARITALPRPMDAGGQPRLSLHALGRSWLPAMDPSFQGAPLLVDGTQPQGGAASWNEWRQSPLLEFAEVDVAGWDNLTHRRSVTFVRPDYYLVHDAVHGEGQIGQVELRFHTDDVEAAEPVRDTVRLTSGASALYLFSLDLNEGVNLVRQALALPNDGGDGWLLRYQRAQDTPPAFYTILLPAQADATRPSLTPMRVYRGDFAVSESEAVAFRLEGLGYRDTYVAQHQHSGPARAGTVALSGRAVLLRRSQEGALYAFQALDAERVEERDRLLLACDAPADVYWEHRKQVVHVTTRSANQVRCHAPNTWRITWNGQDVPFQWEDDYLVAHNPAGP